MDFPLRPGSDHIARLEVGDYIGELLGSDSVRKRANDGSFRFEIGNDSGLYVDPIDNNGEIRSTLKET